LKSHPTFVMRGVGFALAIGAAFVTTRALESKAAGQGQDAKAAQTLNTVCSRCHPIERVTAMRRTRSQWEEVITTMITSRGAQVTDDDFTIILDYLVKEFGRVDINRAAAEDIVEVLGVTDKVAGAIVGYRKEHGRFEDFDALAKVPGVDRDELEKKRDAIAF
jgi:competence ComEA-like helix-hairpin-helix protein